MLYLLFIFILVLSYIDGPVCYRITIHFSKFQRKINILPEFLNKQKIYASRKNLDFAMFFSSKFYFRKVAKREQQPYIFHLHAPIFNILLPLNN